MAKVLKKSELIAELTELGIEHDPNSTNAVLRELLDTGAVNENDEVKTDSKETPILAEEPKAPKPIVAKEVKKVRDPKGDPDVEVGPGQVIKVIAEDEYERELIKLQADKLLVGWNPATREAVVWKR